MTATAAEIRFAGQDPRNSIAVVIPVYNGANFLAEAIESVLAQTLQPNEILVIDDGSTDDSAAIARSFPGVVVASFPNAGPAKNRNRGIELARSRWIAFLDHDDLWVPEKLQKQMDLIRSTTLEPDVCICGRRHFDGDGPGKVQLAPSTAQVVRSLYIRCFFIPSGVIVRRSILLAVGGFDPNEKGCEDWDCWLKLHESGARFVSYPDPLVLYRMHTENRSGNAYMMYRSEMRIYDRHIGPRVHRLLRPLDRIHMQSELLAELAIMERGRGGPHIDIMLRSLTIFPFGHWRRYKIALHMLWKRLSGQPPDPDPDPDPS